MKLLSFFLVMSINLQLSFSQTSEIIHPIKELFDGMRNQEVARIDSAFAEGAMLETYVETKEGVKVQRTPAKAFIEMAGQPHSDVWNEVLWSYDVHRDGPLATVWTEYTFYLGDQMSHCGVNAFQMIRQSNGWKITKITDTRRKEHCLEVTDDKETTEAILAEIDRQVYSPFQQAFMQYDAEAMNALHGLNILRASSRRLREGDEYKMHNAEQYARGKERGDRRSIEFRFDYRKATSTRAVDTGVYKIESQRDGENFTFFGYFHVILNKVAGKWKIVYDFDTNEVNGSPVDASWWKRLE